MLGRIDDLLNLGRVQPMPEDIESAILTSAGLSNVAVCSVEAADGPDDI